MPEGQPITVERIDEQLRRLPPAVLESVFDYVSYLIERYPQPDDDVHLLHAAEDVLTRDWLQPEEDAAWAHL